MVRIQFAIDLQYELTFSGADFVFNIHAAKTAAQTVLSEQLQISQTVLTTIQTDPSTYASYLRLTANAGPLHVGYKATVDIKHHIGNPDEINETPVSLLAAVSTDLHLSQPLLPIRPPRHAGRQGIRRNAQGLSSR
jgi:hypothetical protein